MPSSEAELRSDEDCLRALANSHTNLSRQVHELSSQVSDLSRHTTAEFAVLRRSHFSTVSSNVRRLLLFSSANATKLLKTPHPDLSLAAKKLRPATTFKQGILRSKGSDCTLEDFRSLMRFVLQKETTRCRVFPSEFYAFGTDGHKSDRFDIIFDSFYDLCDALDIGANAREVGAYREKKMSGEVRAIQVSGTVRFGQYRASDCSRIILLGQSPPKQLSVSRLLVLHQETTAWTEHTWNSSFTLQDRTISDVMNATSAPEIGDAEGTRSRVSDLNFPPDERFSFRITWERNADAHRYPQVPPFLVAGSIRSYFPSVFIGTRVLTDSITSIFRTRVNGKLLIEELASPTRN